MDAKTAATELFHKYKGDVYRYALFVLCNPDDAEDVLQEVFLRVLRGWDGFRRDSSAKTWLWRIMKNCITDTLRQQKRRKAEDQSIEGRLEEQDTVHLATSGVEGATLVEWEEILRVLSPRQRQVVYLRLIDDYTTAETAMMLGYTRGTVRVTLHRAVQQLRETLREDWSLFAQSQSAGTGDWSSKAVKRNDGT